MPAAVELHAGEQLQSSQLSACHVTVYPATVSSSPAGRDRLQHEERLFFLAACPTFDVCVTHSSEAPIQSARNDREMGTQAVGSRSLLRSIGSLPALLQLPSSPRGYRQTLGTWCKWWPSATAARACVYVWVWEVQHSRPIGKETCGFFRCMCVGDASFGGGVMTLRATLLHTLLLLHNYCNLWHYRENVVIIHDYNFNTHLTFFDRKNALCWVNSVPLLSMVFCNKKQHFSLTVSCVCVCVHVTGPSSPWP